MSVMTKDEVNVDLFDECKRLQAKVEELTDIEYMEEELMSRNIEIEDLQAKVAELRTRRITDLDWKLELQARKQESE